MSFETPYYEDAPFDPRYSPLADPAVTINLDGTYSFYSREHDFTATAQGRVEAAQGLIDGLAQRGLSAAAREVEANLRLRGYL